MKATKHEILFIHDALANLLAENGRALVMDHYGPKGMSFEDLVLEHGLSRADFEHWPLLEEGIRRYARNYPHVEDLEKLTPEEFDAWMRRVLGSSHAA